MAEAVALICSGLSGWGMGRVKPALQLAVLVFTLFAAVSLHSAIQWAFIDGPRLDAVVGDPRLGAPAAAVLLIAGGEAAGLWLPFLVLPWAALRTRVWMTTYMLSACVAAGIAHYFPAQANFFNAAFIAPEGPPYLFAAVACLPVALTGYLVGWRQRMWTELDDA